MVKKSKKAPITQWARFVRREAELQREFDMLWETSDSDFENDSDPSELDSEDSESTCDSAIPELDFGLIRFVDRNCREGY
mmetsp:Transcript_19710/g.49060  ORF Transcript_19710/g.49060 Transcript_19710/m.49060 type:complete len:80 (+) Transcript_19710:294-533(+)